MMLAWMSYATLAAAAMGATAWLLDFAFAGRVQRRRVLWAGVFLLSALGPIAFSVTRGIATDVAGADVVAGPPARGGREPIVPDRVLVWAWLAMSATVALGLMATHRGLRRRVRGCPSRIVDGERVLVSPDFGPAVVGILRPRIVLPEWVLATREHDRRSIVAHEVEHRQAHDPLLAAAALLVITVLPWNAALWWQLRRLRLAMEIDCDRRVVSRHGHDPRAYGMVLLAARERASRVTPAMVLAMAAMRSGLGRRVEALVDGGQRSAARRVSALAAAVALTAACVSLPAPPLSLPRPADSTVPAAEGHQVRPRSVRTVILPDSSVRRIVEPMTPRAARAPH